eukprot:768600-Hanusia_phi.AAC.9
MEGEEEEEEEEKEEERRLRATWSSAAVDNPRGDEGEEFERPALASPQVPPQAGPAAPLAHPGDRTEDPGRSSCQGAGDARGPGRGWQRAEGTQAVARGTREGREGCVEGCQAAAAGDRIRHAGGGRVPAGNEEGGGRRRQAFPASAEGE